MDQPVSVKSCLAWSLALAFAVVGCSSSGGGGGGGGGQRAEASRPEAKGQTVKVTLSGNTQVPPVQTKATGSGTITVGQDKSVSGSVTTKGVEGTAAHIHEAAPGKSGPVIIPLT